MTANHKPVIELKCSQKFVLLCQELEGQTFSPKLRHHRLYFLPTRDNYVGPGRGHQQWSNPHKRAEYNLKYLIIASSYIPISLPISSSSLSTSITAGIKKYREISSFEHFMKSSTCFDPDYHLLVVWVVVCAMGATVVEAGIWRKKDFADIDCFSFK